MSNDHQLQQAVLAELAWEPSVIAAHIGVTAKTGVVTLTGHVGTFAQKHAAQVAASRVKGVKAVAEEIEVRLSFDMKRGDDDIAGAAIERLAWDVSVPKDAVKVISDHGWITLTGEVGWHYQSEAAEDDVHHLMGVIGVSNQITIKPRVDASGLGDDIQHALNRSVFFDPETVSVTATGGRVRLQGTVHSWHDRSVAANTAWAAPGAIAVVNDIVVV
jgi:osmotically-inducible protein OsmY